MTIWVYGFFDSPRHPEPDVELAGLASINESRRIGEMVELRLPARHDAPGKAAREGDLFVFFVRRQGESRIRGRAVVGGRPRLGFASRRMAELYGDHDQPRYWIPLSAIVLHDPRSPESLGLRENDLPNPSGQAHIKRLRTTDHVDPELLRWARSHQPGASVPAGLYETR